MSYPGRQGHKRNGGCAQSLKLVAVVISVGLACSTNGQGRVCDGSAKLKLRVFGETAPDREIRGSVVQSENGFPSFGLDGLCNYWISAGWTSAIENIEFGWRSGHADQSLQNEIEQAFPLENLESLADCQDTSGLFDATAGVLKSVSSQASCVRGGPRFKAAWLVVESHAMDMWIHGAPMTGGMHVAAVQTMDGDTSKPYPWPAVEPLADFIPPDSLASTNGASRLVGDPATAEALRVLRSQYLDDRRASPGLFFDGQKMTDGSSTATVYMREELPYEDARGLWPFRETPLPP